MADPVLNGGIRVQVIFQGGSGLPEDRFVNTFAMASDAANTFAAKNAAIDSVRNFYMGTNAGGSVAQYMAGATISEALSQIRAYSMEDPPPRAPQIEQWGVSPSLPSTQPLPAEVAVCASYYAVENQPRSRGRIFIGPLNTSAMTASDGINDVRVNNAFQLTLLGAMLTLGASNHTPRWCVLGLAPDGLSQILKPITHCWVDNAFDTQRRRGAKASSRVTGFTEVA